MQKPKSILVTGGAGYIGSHVVKALRSLAQYKVFVLDNLSTGHRDAVMNTSLIQGDIRDKALVSEVLKKERIESVMHLAAKTSVPESISQPYEYYDNNAMGTLVLLEACAEQKVHEFIFSSTAAVYGHPKQPKIDENAATEPTNPYGYSKLVSEHMIQDFATAHQLQYVILRYFNVAGADPDGDIGQRSEKAEHLIKVALDTVNGKRASLPIYGNQYATPDGTCIRDFIHVSDIANAHIAALQYLENHKPSTIFNCGYSQGYSVKQVITTLEDLLGYQINVEVMPPRPGDIPEVIANNQKIREALSWHPQFNDIAFMIKTAYEWEQKNTTTNTHHSQIMKQR
tara:strand:+ start:8136 stop:9161 length:1026 start_codon:yes stop_codon:yes gene_type:complete